MEQDQRTRELFEALGLDPAKCEEFLRLASFGPLLIEPERPANFRLDSMTHGGDEDEETRAELA